MEDRRDGWVAWVAGGVAIVLICIYIVLSTICIDVCGGDCPVDMYFNDGEYHCACNPDHER